MHTGPLAPKRQFLQDSSIRTNQLRSPKSPRAESAGMWDFPARNLPQSPDAAGSYREGLQLVTVCYQQGFIPPSPHPEIIA